MARSTPVLTIMSPMRSGRRKSTRPPGRGADGRGEPVRQRSWPRSMAASSLTMSRRHHSSSRRPSRWSDDMAGACGDRRDVAGLPSNRRRVPAVPARCRAFVTRHRRHRIPRGARGHTGEDTSVIFNAIATYQLAVLSQWPAGMLTWPPSGFHVRTAVREGAIACQKRIGRCPHGLPVRVGGHPRCSTDWCQFAPPRPCRIASTGGRPGGGCRHRQPTNVAGPGGGARSHLGHGATPYIGW